MILTRLGNKRKIAMDLWEYFPKHKLRIELFFGAGGSFFYTPPSQYAILNDLDDDVINLYKMLLYHRDALIYHIKILPISSSLIEYWKPLQELDPIKKAVRFLLLSNFTYLGKGDTLRFSIDNTKKILLDNIDKTLHQLQNAKLMNCDFREVLDKISFSKKLITKNEAFVYLDPVYYGTEHYYKVPTWTEKETQDCFKIMANCGIRCGMSEFDSDLVLDLASDYKMNVITIKERQNIKNRRVELLITNYKEPQLKMNFK